MQLLGIAFILYLLKPPMKNNHDRNLTTATCIWLNSYRCRGTHSSPPPLSPSRDIPSQSKIKERIDVRVHMKAVLHTLLGTTFSSISNQCVGSHAIFLQARVVRLSIRLPFAAATAKKAPCSSVIFGPWVLVR